MNQAVSNFAAWLPAEGVDELFHGGVPTAASGFYPTATAKRADGGWRITGQVSFASGCHHAKWLAMPAVEMEDGRPKSDPTTGQPAVFVGFFPRSAGSVKETWNTVGMRGTGSADIAVHDLFVPDRMTGFIGPLKSPAPGFEGPLYRMFPLHGLLGEAIVSVGVAAAAVDEAVRLCKAKTSAYNVVPLREQQLAQYQIGKASARVEAARDTLYRAADAAYGDVASGGASLSIEAKIRVQLALSFAAETCAEAVRYVNDAIGASSIRLENPFERRFRDLHVLMQHSDKSSARYATAGRLMFGLENDWVWLSF
jgi:alkylation response protein AidB-like acyl-CoA dehydrogenase